MAVLKTETVCYPKL